MWQRKTEKKEVKKKQNYRDQKCWEKYTGVLYGGKIGTKAEMKLKKKFNPTTLNAHWIHSVQLSSPVSNRWQ